MRKTFLAIFLFSVFYNADSQENITSVSHALRKSGSHLFSLSSGYARHIERDDAISPFIYRGSTIPVEVNYRYLGIKNRYVFSFFFDHLTLNSVLPDYGGSGPQYFTENTNISIKNFYIRKVYSFPKNKLDLFFGSGLNLLLNYRLHNTAFSNNNNNYLMLDQFNSLAFMFQAEKKFDNKNHFLTASICIPAISYVLLGNTYNAYVGNAINDLMNSDSNVLFEVVKNGELASFNKLINMNADLSYTRFAGNHIGFELKYSFQYYKFTQFSNLNYSKNLQSCFFIGVIYKL